VVHCQIYDLTSIIAGRLWRQFPDIRMSKYRAEDGFRSACIYQTSPSGGTDGVLHAVA